MVGDVATNFTMIHPEYIPGPNHRCQYLPFDPAEKEEFFKQKEAALQKMVEDKAAKAVEREKAKAPKTQAQVGRITARGGIAKPRGERGSSRGGAGRGGYNGGQMQIANHPMIDGWQEQPFSSTNHMIGQLVGIVAQTYQSGQPLGFTSGSSGYFGQWAGQSGAPRGRGRGGYQGSNFDPNYSRGRGQGQGQTSGGNEATGREEVTKPPPKEQDDTNMN
ncbi:hypothetical protein EAF04_008401 [Stromatinia cepivora]|nr:hypothetical protein EAF04_008401 [Stromatinia cepivora]